MEMMPRLRNCLDGKIEKTLRFSYDGIDSEEDKAIFRQIACLFRFLNLIHIDDIKLLLADIDLSVNIGLQNLVEKSLIHIRNDYVRMHCLLQKVGRKIVRAQSIDEREFWLDSKDICDELNENTGTKKILGILLNTDEIDELCVHESAIKKMSNLRFLKIHTCENEGRLQLDKSFDYLPPTLKLLSWENYPMRCVPSKFRPKNLVILKMQNSKLEKLWEEDPWLPCLKEMNLLGSKELKEIPDLSRATNLEKLNLYGCCSLVELPSSIGNLNKLFWLDMSECTNLETLPSGINLQSLHDLEFRGCSKLKSFPDISRNVSYLILSNTAIEEIPWWVKNFYRLQFLYMNSCSMLKYASISALKRLYIVDFSNCGALVGAGWNGYPSGVAMKTDQIDMELPVPEEASSLPDNFVPRVNFKLLNCVNLDLEALLQQQSVFRQVILSGEEVPLYFTHKATRTSSSLTIPLLQTSLSQPFFRLRACAVIVFDDLQPTRIVDEIKINCRFKDGLGNNFDSPDHREYIWRYENGSHLFIFDCWFPLEENYANLAELNYDHVDIQFHFPDDIDVSCELKEWGVRHLEDYSSTENQLGDPNTILHVSEGDEDNMVNEIEDKEESGTRDSTPSPDNSNIFEDVGDEVNKKKRDSETEEEHGRTSK